MRYGKLQVGTGDCLNKYCNIRGGGGKTPGVNSLYAERKTQLRVRKDMRGGKLDRNVISGFPFQTSGARVRFSYVEK